MKRLALAGFGISVVLGGAAKAADLRVPLIYQPAVPVIAYYNWSACYVGFDVGGLWTTTDWVDQIPGDPAFGTDLGSHTGSGAIGDVRGNCSYQIGSFVIGLEGAYGWSSAAGSSVSALSGALTDEARIRKLGSITGRVGYAWDRFLVYAKGGGASVRRDYALAFNGAGFATASETRGGWTVGIGGEYAFLDWLTGFVEFDYYRFGSGASTFACTGCGLPSPFVTRDATTSISVFKVGLNLLWGPGVGPFGPTY